MMHLAREPSCFVVLAMGLVLATPAHAQRQMENLTRGIVAVKQGRGGVYVGWRLFGTDPESIAFNLYRKEIGRAHV
jgi:rhamnogalacturonan endolyase